MTDFNDTVTFNEDTIFNDNENHAKRLIMRLQGTAPDFSSPIDLVNRIWGFNDGKWEPPGFTSHGDSYITFTEQNQNPPNEPNINVFEITQSGDPLLVVDRGFIVQKDISAGGFLSSNQGELWLGSGRLDQLDQPKIVLSHSDVSILNGGGVIGAEAIPTYNYWPEQVNGRVFIFQNDQHIYKYEAPPSGSGWTDKGPAANYSGKYFDTLYITKFGLDNTPANLNLGSLYAQHIYVRGTGNTNSGAHFWSSASNNFSLATQTSSGSPAWKIGYGDGNGDIDTSTGKPWVYASGNEISFFNFNVRANHYYDENGSSNATFHGNVTGNANYATTAGSCSTATNATNASYATTAGSSSSASAIPVLSSDPSSPATGSIWLKT